MPLDQIGSNTPSNDATADWTRQYRTQKRRCDEENGILRNIIKRAKSDGINTRAMIDAVKATKLDPDVVASDLRDTIRIMAMLRIPLTQAELFDGFDLQLSSATRLKDDLWDAQDGGYKAGRHGKAPEECPYESESELYSAWMEYWQKGQAAIARELGPDVKQASTAKQRTKRAQQLPLNEISTEYTAHAPAYVPGKAATKARKTRTKHPRGRKASTARDASAA